MTAEEPLTTVEQMLVEPDNAPRSGADKRGDSLQVLGHLSNRASSDLHAPPVDEEDRRHGRHICFLLTNQQEVDVGARIPEALRDGTFQHQR